MTAVGCVAKRARANFVHQVWIQRPLQQSFDFQVIPPGRSSCELMALLGCGILEAQFHDLQVGMSLHWDIIPKDRHSTDPIEAAREL